MPDKTANYKAAVVVEARMKKIADLLDFDHTWTLGHFYIDLCGGLHGEIHLGMTAAFSLDKLACWGRRVSLHLGFWCLTVGWD